MTQVDFYLTQSNQLKHALITACRLTQKALNQGHDVFIHADDAHQAEQIDKLLWTFNQRSFIPHAVIEGDNDKPCYEKVVIAYDHDHEVKHDVLINLAPRIPEFFSRFKRVAEIVSSDEEQRQQAREKFKFYRDRGYELNTHELKG